MFSKNRKKSSRRGISILIVLLVGEMFIPISPDETSLKWLMILSLLMVLFIYLMVRLVNTISHNGKIFEGYLSLSSFQKFSVLATLAYFIFLYVQNGNISSIISLSHSSLKIIITCTAIALGAGFFEEYFVRGYLFNLFQRILKKFKWTKNNLTIVSVVTSMIFGFTHLVNLSVDPAKAVYQQVFYATCIGLFFALIRIVTNSIYVGAGLHVLFDLQVDIYQTSTPDIWLNIIIVYLPIALISIGIIRSLDNSVSKDNILILEP